MSAVFWVSLVPVCPNSNDDFDASADVEWLSPDDDAADDKVISKPPTQRIKHEAYYLLQHSSPRALLLELL